MFPMSQEFTLARRDLAAIGMLCALTAMPGCAREGGVCQTGAGASELRSLLDNARSAERHVWFPATRELGRRAAADSPSRDRIWAEARVNSLGMKFVRIEPGEFWMGPPYQNALWMREAHAVRVTQPFYICATETTNEQYALLRQGYKPESRFSPDPESPAVDLSWDDVQAFCRDLSDREGAVYRLPTEAEWEYVCRAGMPSPHEFCFGDDINLLAEYAWYGKHQSSAAPVALLKPNAWGVYDMHGNAMEVVQDWFSSDFNGAQTAVVAVDPEGPSDGFNHTLRGGNWYAADVRGCGCSFRYPWPFLDIRLSGNIPRLRQTIGFRIVREADEGG